MKHPAKTDIAVLLLFFTRSDTFAKVFEAVRQARPSKLLLYQDGPRNQREADKLAAARSIVADDKIDWQCDVQRSYHTENAGAWASNYQAQRLYRRMGFMDGELKRHYYLDNHEDALDMVAQLEEVKG